MKLLIIGGHFMPALAVIEALPSDAEVIYAGRKHTFEGDSAVSLEYHIMKQKGIRFVNLTTGRLQRKFTRYTIPTLLKIPYGFFQSLTILRKTKPDVILSLGGYVALPVCFAGFLLKIPIVIHEQTLEAGLTNEHTKWLAKKICISWESSRKFFPSKKVILTGIPVMPAQCKKGTCTYLPKFSSNRKVICIIGGSAGSHAINILVEGCIERLLKDYIVIHQIGDAKEFGDYDRLQKLKDHLDPTIGKNYHIFSFIDPYHITCLLQRADFVISRSGINSVILLLLLKKPCLLIPIPFSQRNEQYKNALLLQNAGLGKIYEQKELTSEKLFDSIRSMVNNKEKYIFKKPPFSFPDPMEAAQKIIEVLYHVAQKKTTQT